MEKKYYIFLNRIDGAFMLATKNIADKTMKLICHGKLYEMKAYANSLITRTNVSEHQRLLNNIIAHGIFTVLDKFQYGDTKPQVVEDAEVLVKEEKENTNE